MTSSISRNRFPKPYEVLGPVRTSHCGSFASDLMGSHHSRADKISRTNRQSGLDSTIQHVKRDLHPSLHAKDAEMQPIQSSFQNEEPRDLRKIFTEVCNHGQDLAANRHPATS